MENGFRGQDFKFIPHSKEDSFSDHIFCGILSKVGIISKSGTINNVNNVYVII